MLRKIVVALTAAVLLVTGTTVLASSGSFDPNGKPPTKGFVAVEAYKWMRDNVPDAIKGCEKDVDQFDDLSQDGVSKFKRQAINCLSSLGFFNGYPGVPYIEPVTIFRSPPGGETRVGGQGHRVVDLDVSLGGFCKVAADVEDNYSGRSDYDTNFIVEMVYPEWDLWVNEIIGFGRFETSANLQKGDGYVTIEVKAAVDAVWSVSLSCRG